MAGWALLAGYHRNGILMWNMFLSHDLIIIGASGSGLLQQTFIFIIRRQLTYIGKIIRGYANDTQTTPCQLLWLLLAVYFNRQFGSKALPGPLMIYIWWCIHQYTHTYTFPLFHTFSNSLPLFDLTPMLTCRILPELAGVDSIATLFCYILTCFQGFTLRILYLHAFHRVQGCWLVRYLIPITLTALISYC